MEKGDSIKNKKNKIKYPNIHRSTYMRDYIPHSEGCPSESFSPDRKKGDKRLHKMNTLSIYKVYFNN